MNRIFQDPAPTPSAPVVIAPAASPKLIATLGRLIDLSLHGSLVFSILWFCGFTVDVLELPKQTALVVFACLGLVAWLGKSLAERRFALASNWLHLMVGLFGLGWLLLAFTSQDRYQSFVGALGQMPWSFATVGSLVILYFLAVNRIRSVTQAYNLLFTFFAASLVAALYGFTQLAGWFLTSVDLAQSKAFTSVGSAYSLAMFLTAPLVAAAALAFHGCRDGVCLLGDRHPMGRFARVLVWATAAVSGLYLVLVDLKSAWAVLFLATAALLGLASWRTNLIHRPVRLVLPGVILIVSALLFFFPAPLKVELPTEVSPSHLASWEIAKQSLQAHPVFGSGPGTWSQDYARYRVQAINLSPFWNIRFDRGYSTFLTLLATTGMVGMALWFLLTLSALIRTATHLAGERNEDHWYAYATVFAGWTALFLSSFVYNFNVAHQAAFWILLAVLGSFVSVNVWVWDAKRHPGIFLALTVKFAVLIIIGISLMWLAGQRFAADRLFRKAVVANRSNASISDVVGFLERARSLNPLADIYARNLSQAYLMQTLQIAAARPSPEDFREVGGYATKAVDAALAARDRSPENVDNWSNLASMYVGIMSFSRGADEHATEAYTQAAAREPQNPVFVTELGRIAYLRADAFRTALSDKDAKKRAEAEAAVRDNLAKAQDHLKRAIALKSDYFPAHYHLAVVFERQGRIKESIAELEQVLALNTQDAGVAFELAILYYRNNEKPRAVNLMEQIAKAQPDNANVRWYLASLYEELGNTDGAIAQLRVLAQKVPGNAAVEQRLQALEQSRGGAPTVRPLPEPISEGVSGPSDQNPLRR